MALTIFLPGFRVANHDRETSRSFPDVWLKVRLEGGLWEQSEWDDFPTQRQITPAL